MYYTVRRNTHLPRLLKKEEVLTTCGALIFACVKKRKVYYNLVPTVVPTA
jgi:hypothetical protein